MRGGIPLGPLGVFAFGKQILAQSYKTTGAPVHFLTARTSRIGFGLIARDPAPSIQKIPAAGLQFFLEPLFGPLVARFGGGKS